MKIAFFNIYQQEIARGSETFVREIAQRLLKENEVEIISDKIKVKGRWPLIWRTFLDPQGLQIFWFTFKNIPLLWRKKYDVIIPLNGGWQPAIIRMITWLYGGKMVISGQSGMGWDERNNIWSFPDIFIALSSTAKIWAKKNNPFVRVEQISNGVDLKKFTPNGPVFKNGLKKPVVLCVGAFTKQKRLNLAVDAVAGVKGATLLIAGGGGDLKKEIEDYGLKILGKDRFQITSVPFAKMPEVYRSADVFTLPSASSEAFGNVLVEAMASGLSVVATNDTIRKEIVGDAGILTDPVNAVEYSGALKKALETNWEEKPRNQAEKYSWDYIAQRYAVLFKSLFNFN